MSRDVGGFVRSAPTLYAQLFRWLAGVSFFTVSMLVLDKKRAGRAALKVCADVCDINLVFRVSTPTMRFHLHNAMTSLWANREKDGRIRRLHFARAQTLLYKRGGKA